MSVVVSVCTRLHAARGTRLPPRRGWVEWLVPEVNFQRLKSARWQGALKSALEVEGLFIDWVDACAKRSIDLEHPRVGQLLDFLRGAGWGPQHFVVRVQSPQDVIRAKTPFLDALGATPQIEVVSDRGGRPRNYALVLRHAPNPRSGAASASSDQLALITFLIAASIFQSMKKKEVFDGKGSVPSGHHAAAW